MEIAHCCKETEQEIGTVTFDGKAVKYYRTPGLGHCSLLLWKEEKQGKHGKLSNCSQKLSSIPHFTANESGISSLTYLIEEKFSLSMVSFFQLIALMVSSALKGY
jgi:hypothetical protein